MQVALYEALGSKENCDSGPRSPGSENAVLCQLFHLVLNGACSRSGTLIGPNPAWLRKLSGLFTKIGPAFQLIRVPPSINHSSTLEPPRR